MEWAAGKWLPRAIFHSNAMWIAKKVFTWKVFVCACAHHQRGWQTLLPLVTDGHDILLELQNFELYSLSSLKFLRISCSLIVAEILKKLTQTYVVADTVTDEIIELKIVRNKKRMKNTKASRVEINNNKSKIFITCMHFINCKLSINTIY